MNKLNSASIISDSPEEYNIYGDIRNQAQYYVPLGIIITLLLIGFFWLGYMAIQIPEYFTEYEAERQLGEPIKKIAEAQPVEVTQEVIEEETPVEDPAVHVHMTDDDIIAAVVMSEAGNQEMVGKVAVAAVILNRCDYFDLTVEQVVNAKNQFSYPYYGKIDDSAYRAVEIARENRDLFDANMLYFRNQHYHDFGEPYVCIGQHYFSLAEEREDLNND